MNSCTPFGAYRISSADPSTTWVHLHTTGLLYQHTGEKSRFFGQVDDFGHSFHDVVKTALAVGQKAVGAIFDPCIGVCEIPTALIFQCIEGAVAEKAVKGVTIRFFVTWEVFAFFVLKELIIFHRTLLAAVVQ